MACDVTSSLSRACSTAGLPSGFLSIRWTMQWRIGMAVSWANEPGGEVYPKRGTDFGADVPVREDEGQTAGRCQSPVHRYRKFPWAGLWASVLTLLQGFQSLDHVAHMHVQFVELVGVGQRHFDCGELVFQMLQPLDFTDQFGRQGAGMQLAVDLAQVLAPAVDARAAATLVDRTDSLEQRDHPHDQRDQLDDVEVGQRGDAKWQVVLQDR